MRRRSDDGQLECAVRFRSQPAEVCEIKFAVTILYSMNMVGTPARAAQALVLVDRVA
jgi:hypothetical protein